MKYIYEREQWKNQYKINEILDYDKVDVPDFSDTLLGGALNRLLGFGRSMGQGIKMDVYAKQLDRILASVLIEPAMAKGEIPKGNLEKYSTIKALTKAVDEIEKDPKNADLTSLPPKEELLKLGPYIEELTKPILELVADTEESGVSVIEVKPGEMVVYKGQQLQVIEVGEEMIKAKTKEGKEVEVSKNDIEKKEEGGNEGESEESEIKVGEIVSYKGTKIKVVEVGEDTIKAETEEGKEVEVPKSEIERKKEGGNEGEENTGDNSKNIEEFKRKYGKLENFCKKCGSNNDELNNLLSTIKNRIENLEKNWDDGDANELGNAFSLARKKCEKCKTNDSPVKESLKNDILLLLEAEGSDDPKMDATRSDLSKVFDRLRKELASLSKKLNITNKQVRSLDKEIESKKGMQEINGKQAKALMNVLTKAKNSLLHTKPYEEIRKKQKRYFDKLDSSTTGRAINRKGYQTWANKVNEILAYYKDKLPKKVIELVSDSLDKEHIANDYVKLNKVFLGINKRADSKLEEFGKGKTFEVGTSDNELGFVGVQRLSLSQFNKRISVFLEISSKNYTGNVIAIVTESLKEKKFFNFKFVKSTNIKWIERAYYNGKTIDTKTAISSDKVEYENNSDLEKVNFIRDDKYNVYYGQSDVGSDQIKKGQSINVNIIDFTKLIQGGYISETDGKDSLNRNRINDIEGLTTKESWTINKIGVLVGKKDHKASLSKANGEMMNKEKDAYLDESIFYDIASLFDGSLDVGTKGEKEEQEESKEEPQGDFEELKRKNPKTIKYKSESGEEREREVVEWKEEGVNIKGNDGSTPYIAKDRINYDF